MSESEFAGADGLLSSTTAFADAWRSVLPTIVLRPSRPERVYMDILKNIIRTDYSPDALR